jgi:hypothetical protein
MNIPTVPKPETPVFMDEVVVQIQDILKANLPWLDYSFGRSQKLVTKKDKKDYFYPGIHLGDEKYINVFPDQSLGNFSFMAFEDPEDIDVKLKPYIKVTKNFSLIFWFNIDKIFEDQKDRNLETVKLQILTVLNTKMFLNKGRISMSTIQEDAKNIYKGYSINELASQFLMHPYAGLRFDGVMTYTSTLC